eukprot:PhF_6_TR40740/c0_g1_i2/m.61322
MHPDKRKELTRIVTENSISASMSNSSFSSVGGGGKTRYSTSPTPRPSDSPTHRSRRVSVAKKSSTPSTPTASALANFSFGSSAGSPVTTIRRRISVAKTSTENVKVMCRVRPFNERELALGKGLRPVIAIQNNSVILLDHTTDYTEREKFDFDGAFWSVNEEMADPEQRPFATQEVLFDAIGRPTLEHAWAGYHACLFAYGQTGAGKTYTMMGSQEEPGLIPNICNHLFTMIAENSLKNSKEMSDGHGDDNIVIEYRVEATFLEIYNEKVRDLLYQYPEIPDPHDTVDHENLKVRNVPTMGPFVVGLITVPVNDWGTCREVLELGTLNRHVAATKMNDNSSRSHCIFRLTFTQVTKVLPTKQFDKIKTFEKVSVINLVDLAGSERNKKSGAQGVRLKEAAAINQSLTTLKNVIDALVEGRPVIPYRESQLTWLLSESIGGNSRTFMVSAVSPHWDNAEESLNTLRYALRTRGIVCHARINEDEEGRRILELQKELDRMKDELAKDPNTGKSQDELAVEMEVVVEVLNKLKTDATQNVEEEKELKRLLDSQRSMRYAAAYHNSFRVAFQRHLMERMVKKVNSVRRVLHTNAESNETKRAILDQETNLLKELETLDDELEVDVWQRKEKLNELKHRNTILEHWITNLTNMKVANQHRHAHYAWQTKMIKFVFALMNSHIRRRGSESMQQLFDRQMVDRIEIMKTFEERFDSQKQTDSEKTRDLKNQLSFLQSRIDQHKKEKDHKIVDLEEEINALGAEAMLASREMIMQREETDDRISSESIRRQKRLEDVRQQWKTKISQDSESASARYNAAMLDIAMRNDLLKMESAASLRRVKELGEKRLHQIDVQWEDKIGCWGLRDLCERHEYVTQDLLEAQKEWTQNHDHLDMLWGNIQTLINTSGSATSSAEFNSLAEKVKSIAENTSIPMIASTPFTSTVPLQFQINPLTPLTQPQKQEPVARTNSHTAPFGRSHTGSSTGSASMVSPRFKIHSSAGNFVYSRSPTTCFVVNQHTTESPSRSRAYSNIGEMVKTPRQSVTHKSNTSRSNTPMVLTNTTTSVLASTTATLTTNKIGEPVTAKSIPKLVLTPFQRSHTVLEKAPNVVRRQSDVTAPHQKRKTPAAAATGGANTSRRVERSNSNFNPPTALSYTSTPVAANVPQVKRVPLTGRKY